nr:HVO_2523 family zinc finger protein [Halorubrum sp. CSM-61]
MSDGDGGANDAEGVTTDAGGRPCPLCETPMYHRHCKYVCPEHGVVYDCSDTFY